MLALVYPKAIGHFWSPISPILHSWAAMCQQSWVWQCGYTDGCTDSCCWEWTQHLAKYHHSHSQKVPAG